MKIRQTEKVTVVGAGLVGSLLSIYLARKGFSVDVYERRDDMRKSKVIAGRSINLAISTRGLHALAQLGLELPVLQRAIPMRGRMVHSVTGELSFQRYGKDETQCIHSISRGELNQFLMEEAEVSKKVQFHFQHKLVPTKSRDEELEFRRESDGSAHRVSAPVVFGTDGAYSAARARMVEGGISQETVHTLDYGYKELILPAIKHGDFQLEKHALHIWPRGSFMLIALPNFDGSFTCTLFLPFEGKSSFASLQTTLQVENFFRSQFPDVMDLLPDLKEDFFNHPTGQMVTVKCSPWNLRGQQLLLGDAAHAIVPFFGQGMNCGFEDCAVLDQYLENSDREWEEVFTSFSEARKTNSDAIAAMALENFVEMRDSVANPKFLLQKEVERMLQQYFPQDYLSRYQMVTFSRIPYRKAYEIGLKESEILSSLTEGVKGAEEVDRERAIQLAEKTLLPLMKQARDQSH